MNLSKNKNFNKYRYQQEVEIDPKMYYHHSGNKDNRLDDSSKDFRVTIDLSGNTLWT